MDSSCFELHIYSVTFKFIFTVYKYEKPVLMLNRFKEI